MIPVVGSTELPLERIRRGKVRDVYAVDADRLLLVASDRVSAFDVVMNELVPFKGDRKSTRLNSSHSQQSRMPSSA